LELHVCFVVEEQAHTLCMPILTSGMKASHAAVVLLVNISLSLDHQLQALGLTLPRSQYESCLPTFILELHICIAIDEQAHTLCMPISTLCESSIPTQMD
jgi:hypothetical protein